MGAAAIIRREKRHETSGLFPAMTAKAQSTHECCQLASKPLSNSDYWSAKLERNCERDALHQEALRDLGYEFLTVWECETNLAGGFCYPPRQRAVIMMKF